ncbi:TetR family transcriptional regulator, partial [Streptomyces sp. NPDC007162]|uniref:TetR family transcriptional regulator n=1 Tax=Streptomyces sp. NPDC007162 TaxID=3156917 RepID=UPI0033E4BB63
DFPLAFQTAWAILLNKLRETVPESVDLLRLCMDRVHRTIDSYLRYAEHHQAAYRTIVSGGVGFDAEVHAIRDGVREAIVVTIAEGAYGRTDIAPLARMGLLSWLCSVEGATLEWIDRPGLSRDTMCELLVKTLGGTLRAIEELDPSYPAPAPARRDT